MTNEQAADAHFEAERAKEREAEENCFATRLRRAREAAGLTLTQTAERANISKTYLWELERETKLTLSVDVAQRLAAALSVGLMDLVGHTEPSEWPKQYAQCLPILRPITEDWLVANGFKIESGRNDDRYPIRSLHIGSHFIGGRPFLGSSDDLCIDISPAVRDRREWHVWRDRKEWHVWIAQREPYRFVPVRLVRETWELVRLYEGLTGRVWPGSL